VIICASIQHYPARDARPGTTGECIGVRIDPARMHGRIIVDKEHCIMCCKRESLIPSFGDVGFHAILNPDTASGGNGLDQFGWTTGLCPSDHNDLGVASHLRDD